MRCERGSEHPPIPIIGLHSFYHCHKSPPTAVLPHKEATYENQPLSPPHRETARTATGTITQTNSNSAHMSQLKAAGNFSLQ